MQTAFIGAGKMATAIMQALLKSEVLFPPDITASDADAALLAAVAKALQIAAAPDNRAAARDAAIVFLCVKPQQLDAVLDELADTLTERHLVLSIAAGKRLASIEGKIPRARVIRVMPNVCCLVGEGMNVFTLGARATAEDRETALHLLGPCGLAHELPEDQFDAVTALSGSGPAFCARFLVHLVEGAQAEGMAPEHARVLAVQTLLGTAALLQRTDLTPEQLIRNVTSAKGTTAEGLAVLEGSDFGNITRAVIAAAARRSRELSGS